MQKYLQGETEIFGNPRLIATFSTKNLRNFVFVATVRSQI